MVQVVLGQRLGDGAGNVGVLSQDQGLQGGGPGAGAPGSRDGARHARGREVNVDGCTQASQIAQGGQVTGALEDVGAQLGQQPALEAKIVTS